MLAAIRKFAKSPFATLLLGLLVVSFGIWGIRDVFRTSGFSDAVVKAGSRPEIDSAEFKDLFSREKTQREQQAGQAISNEDMVKFGIDRQMVDELAATESIGALMASEGVNPADELIGAEIQKIKAFFNPVTGQFDKQIYARLLAERHITTTQADGEFRDTIAQREYQIGLAAGLKAPRIYGLVEAALQREGRDFTWFSVGPTAVDQPAKPTDAQLLAFMKDNAQGFTKPELRQISLVRFSPAAVAATIEAPEANVQKRFDFEKDSLNTPEKRTVIQVAVKDAKTGADVAAKLKAGGDPAAVAKAAGAQATSYPATPKAAIADRKIADAAFAMKAGEVSGPVQGDLGLSVIKVTDIAPGKTVTLAEARPKIEAEVKQELAKQKVYDLVQKFEDAHSGGADLAASAKAAGVEVNTLPLMTAKGAVLTGQRANLPPKVMQTAFTLPAGGESDAMDLGQGEYWAVHVDKVQAPALFGLDEQVGTEKVRDAVVKQYMLNQLMTKLKAKADTLTDEIRKGKTMEAAAAEVKATVAHADNVTRAAAQPPAQGQPPAWSPDVLGRIFQAKPGEVIAGQDTKPGIIIARFDKMQEAPAPVLAALAEASRQTISRALFGDIGGNLRLAAEKKIKPTIDYKRARQAIGVDPNLGAPPSGKAN